MIEKIKELLVNFNQIGEVDKVRELGGGHINSTFYVKLNDNGKEKEFVIQRINHNVFTNPEELMENIASVTNHIKKKIRSQESDSSRAVINFCKSIDGKHSYQDENGDFWRMYKYISNSKTYNSTNSLKVLNETGKAFGEFQLLLDDFPINELHITIPNFHNTKNRYKQFYKALKEDPVGRVNSVKTLINDYIALENLATKMYDMHENGKLKLRVTHNDTKCNNVLFDKTTNKKLCVIDLDTVMPGLVGFDFGDAIRFGANSSAEDEHDLTKVKIDLDKFEAFTKGFLSKLSKTLTPKEMSTLSLGAITMTIECGLRFLTDYIDGDNYFKVNYPEHNMVRAKCQLALAQDMIKNYKKMQEIVHNCCKEYNL